MAKVGEGTWFATAPLIAGGGAVEFGRWCAIGRDLSIITQNHDMRLANMHVPLQRLLELPDNYLVRDVKVGDATWIGDGVTLLPGAMVGTGSVIGAGAVVTGEIPPFVVASGLPARVVRSRFPTDVVDALQEIAWWEWSIDRMRRSRALFEIDLTAASGDDVRRCASWSHSA